MRPGIFKKASLFERCSLLILVLRTQGKGTCQLTIAPPVPTMFGHLRQGLKINLAAETCTECLGRKQGSRIECGSPCIVALYIGWPYNIVNSCRETRQASKEHRRKYPHV
ncbi:hypothetical protein GGI35DRAFT_453161, partial [Trichoderma velutinum]